MILYSAISGFLNGIAVMFFGLLVWFNCPRKKVRNLMVLMCFAIVVWGTSWGFAAIARDKTLAIFLNKLLDFAAVFIPIFFLHWVLVLLEIEKEKRSKIVLTLGYLFTLFFTSFAFTSYFTVIELVAPFFYYPKAGILHPFYLVFSYMGLVGYAFYELLKAHKQSIGYEKEQIRYVLLGAILGFGGGATNFFLFYNIPIFPYGNPLVAVGFGLLTYAVIRYRLMDIRIVLGKGVAYAFSFATVIGAGILLVYLNNLLAIPLPVSVVVSFIALVSILFFQLHKFYEKLAEQYFYRTFYNTKIAISELEERLTRVLELKPLSLLIINTLRDIFRLDRVAVLTKEAKEEKYIIQKVINFKRKELTSLTKEKIFISYLEKTKKLLIKEEFESLIIKKLETKDRIEQIRKLRNNIKELGIGVLIPIIFNKEVIGIIFLGNKKSGEAFSSEDLELLEIFSRQVPIALKNASLFAEINKRRQELETFYRLTINRELKMRGLEKKIKELQEKLKKKE